jgi:hypothetical protein
MSNFERRNQWGGSIFMESVSWGVYTMDLLLDLEQFSMSNFERRHPWSGLNGFIFTISRFGPSGLHGTVQRLILKEETSGADPYSPYPDSDPQAAMNV